MTQVIGKMKLLKWWMPLLLVAALVAAGGVAWSQQGGSGGGSFPEITDINPAYDNEVVMPAENPLPVVLYMIEMDPATSAPAVGGGDLATIILTNLIPEPLANGSVVGSVIPPTPGSAPGDPVIVVAHGDLTGNVTVTGQIYNTFNVYGCLATYPEPTDVTVINFPNITVHPGKTVTLQFPVIPGQNGIAGAIFLLKSEFHLSQAYLSSSGLVGVNATTHVPYMYPVP